MIKFWHTSSKTSNLFPYQWRPGAIILQKLSPLERTIELALHKEFPQNLPTSSDMPTSSISYHTFMQNVENWVGFTKHSQVNGLIWWRTWLSLSVGSVCWNAVFGRSVSWWPPSWRRPWRVLCTSMTLGWTVFWTCCFLCWIRTSRTTARTVLSTSASSVTLLRG